MLNLDKNVLNSLSFAELQEAQAMIQAAAQEREAGARTEAQTSVMAIIAQFGFTSAELFPNETKGKSRAGTKVAAKYQDPASGATWTGRGVAPVWIRDVPKDQRDQFLIQAGGKTAYEGNPNVANEVGQTEESTPDTSADKLDEEGRFGENEFVNDGTEEAAAELRERTTNLALDPPLDHIKPQHVPEVEETPAQEEAEYVPTPEPEGEGDEAIEETIETNTQASASTFQDEDDSVADPVTDRLPASNLFARPAAE